MHSPAAPSKVTTAQVFAIAGPAMIANLTTPLIGIVSTTAIGRLGDATLLGGVAVASVLFDCLFWLFGFLRMSTVAFTAQALGAGDTQELRAILLRGFIAAGLVGAGLILLQTPLASLLLEAMGGSEGVTRAAKTYFTIRIWSAPLALGNYVVLGWLIGQARARLALGTQIAINLINAAATALLVLVLDFGIAGAAIAAVIAEAAGLLLGILIARRLSHGQPAILRATLFDRTKLMRLLAVNRDILIRTAALIAAFLFFTAQGARAGDLTLAANAVLNNFLMISAFFLDGLANAAEQLCGRAYGGRDRRGFAGAVKLVVLWGFGFALAVAAVFALFGPALIDIMTASADVRRIARDFLPFVIFAPLLGVFAFAFDGVYIGATWARDMRNLMLLSLAIFLGAWLALRSFGNAGLWGALLVHYAARGGLEALRYPALLRKSFGG
ncbi:MATE family efflux transporter [Bradyrhizobium sp. AUGA SZCCT0240]|uniref:MATE family efflux transporter n=1 Tax=unclassified Bradyrhizobium TaxID=2631580 RepID=UPI001BAD7615|nr:MULTISPECIES: MATE family efflux transporter [unclassified Bradyrhizobium]MBR1195130.1 MATE family efflux transporter [Bradyrhizobium sp. AUGA SZCCT0158]MBR1243808.1 MATE family efflux transporter [Bradyrhizobium sp. AUGA SZCCT0274]MBR1253041.1 MATE family efflux transporter [Bradyrhizobium sp. AUGA SZCCT0240]